MYRNAFFRFDIPRRLFIDLQKMEVHALNSVTSASIYLSVRSHIPRDVKLQRSICVPDIFYLCMDEGTKHC